MITSWNRRQRLDIVYEILDACKHGKLKTHVVYKSNINHKLVEKYIAVLLKSRLIVAKNVGSGLPIYATTERGLLFLRSYKTLRTLFSTTDTHDLSDHDMIKAKFC